MMSYILTPPLPHNQRQVMWVKCEQPEDELTVQIWLLIIKSLSIEVYVYMG